MGSPSAFGAKVISSLLMYRGDYEGVHQGNIGWVVVDH